MQSPRGTVKRRHFHQIKVHVYVGSLCMSEAKENYTHVIKKNELGLTKESHRKNARLYFEHL